jgi:hypothetical protein
MVLTNRALPLLQLTHIDPLQSIAFHCIASHLPLYHSLTLAMSSSLSAASDFSNNHRVAAFVSNAGVTLMERGSFRAASDMLKNAVTLMNKGVLSSTIAITPAEIQEMTLRATQELVSTSKRPVFAVQTLVYGESDVPAMYEAMNDGASVVYPLRMETLEETDTVSAQISASIILYNYGLAHYCLSQSKRASTNAHTYQSAVKCSSHMLRMANQILMQVGLKFDNIHAEQMASFMGITGLVLTTLTRMLLEQDLREEATETYSAMIQVRAVMAEMTDKSCASVLDLAAAAA